MWLALCEGNSQVTGGFSSQRSQQRRERSMSWRRMTHFSVTVLRSFDRITGGYIAISFNIWICQKHNIYWYARGEFDFFCTFSILFPPIGYVPVSWSHTKQSIILSANIKCVARQFSDLCLCAVPRPSSAIWRNRFSSFPKIVWHCLCIWRDCK